MFINITFCRLCSSVTAFFGGVIYIYTHMCMHMYVYIRIQIRSYTEIVYVCVGLVPESLGKKITSVDG